jgi:cytochrome c oxidase subunit 2
MNFGDWPNGAVRKMAVTLAAVALAIAPTAAVAQEPAPAAAPAVAPAAQAPATTTTTATTETPADAAPADSAAPEGAAGYTPLGPDMIKGQPVDGAIDLQPQFSEIGETAQPFHVALVWIMAIISIFVLGLLLWVVLRYNKRANPTPDKTTHNTMIEVIWTVVPVLILIGIAIPSITLLAKQYESPPEDAITVKVTGYQWNWGYELPDHGVGEFISNMMPEDEAKAKGFPGQLEVTERIVVPVNTPLRMQITAADVIHSFAVPSLWFKLDAVPGRLNEKMLIIKEPGIYYGQCSELCGVRHGYMPIAVEAVSRPQWEAWVRSKGGNPEGTAAAEAAAAAAAPAPAADNPATPANEAAAAGAEAPAADAAATPAPAAPAAQ